MFKKLKKFYKNNRIYCILMIISIICIILMGTSVAVYFLNQLSTDPYGDRLNKIDEYYLGTTLTDLENFYKEQEGTISASARTQGRIIYVTVEVSPEMKNEQIENMATSSLEKISEENKSYYDMQFIIKRENMTSYFGSKNANNPVIIWSNYTYNTTEETTTKK